VRKLGAGGMAAVYLAKDIKHDREVAIKVLHPELAATIGGDRFEREIKTAAKLQHPNILGMFDSGSADGLLFYVMPFVEGESLRDRLDRETQLPVDDAIQICLEVADALGHAHAKGIVHRDIKPDNVMLTGGHALVADFGIARASAEGTEKLTSTGMSVGTPTYMAPEQAVGETVGPTADLYSLGCMLYEMLAGEPPFTGKNGAAIMAKHAMETVPSIRVVRPNVPEEVEAAIFASMGKVPADRPQSAAAFMEIFGVPLSQTGTRRIVRPTGTYRVPTGAQPLLQLPVPVWKRPWFAGVAVAAVAAAAFGGYQMTRGGVAGGDTGLPKTNVAVLYFGSPDSSLQYLADGLTEGLIENLTGVQGISVVTRSGSEQVRDAGLAMDSIGHLLNAGTLISGDVRPEGDGVKVNVQLIDGTGGADIGRPEAFTVPLADLNAVRDSLAQVVSRLVRQQVGQEVTLAAQRAETRNSNAWSLYQRAEQLRRRAEETGDPEVVDREFRVADSLLAQAEQLDGNWVRPVIARANLDYRRAYRYVPRDPVTVKPWIDSGLVDVDRALAMDGANADALELRGNLRYWGFLLGVEATDAEAEADLAQAKADLEEATTKNPLQAGAWSSLSHLYNYGGTMVDIGMAARRALEADAFLGNADQILDRLFLAYYDQDNPVEAERWCSESHKRFPEAYYWARCSLYLLTMRSKSPDISRAWQLADTMVALTPPNARLRTMNGFRANMLVAAVIARSSDSLERSDPAMAKTLADSAKAVAQRSLGNAEIDGPRELPHAAAYVYTLLGETDKAVEYLGIHLAANERKRSSFASDPGWWFRSIQNDPKFARLVGVR